MYGWDSRTLSSASLAKPVQLQRGCSPYLIVNPAICGCLSIRPSWRGQALDFSIFWQNCSVPVPNGVHNVKEDPHKNGGHWSQDQVSKCVFIGQDYHKEELDGVQNGIESVLHPTDCASDLFLDTLLWASQTRSLKYHLKWHVYSACLQYLCDAEVGNPEPETCSSNGNEECKDGCITRDVALIFGLACRLDVCLVVLWKSFIASLHSYIWGLHFTVVQVMSKHMAWT